MSNERIESDLFDSKMNMRRPHRRTAGRLHHFSNRAIHRNGIAFGHDCLEAESAFYIGLNRCSEARLLECPIGPLHVVFPPGIGMPYIHQRSWDGGAA